MRGLHAAVIDEADQVLVDDATPPLLVNRTEGGPAPDSELHYQARAMALSLSKDRDFKIDSASGLMQLTESGFQKVYADDDSATHRQLRRPWHEYVRAALRAAHLIARDKHYVVVEGEIHLVEKSTGRVFRDRTWTDGLHQAIQVKERLSITAESESQGRITRQSFFRLYQHLCGMTGTATTCKSELRSVYGLGVAEIDTLRPSNRRMLPTRVCASIGDKLESLRSEIREVIEAGRMAGCRNRQMMWKVLVPSAVPTLMVGVNQVIMLTLNMVIIASMIGAGGLGVDVLSSLRRLDIGGGIEAGLGIVVMALALDRASQAFAERSARRPLEGNLLQRHPWSGTVFQVIASTLILGRFVTAVQTYPDALTITTGPFWSNTMEWINVNFFDTFEAIKTVILQWLLLPVKKFFAGIPWAWGIIATALIAWRVGGWKIGLLAGLLMSFIAASGLWPKAMVTIYLCGVSVLIATIIGIPLGIWAAESPRAGRVILGVMDTLQTLPSFVYLIPVVMLFRVGDFSAMIAVILYALAPAVRYAAHGLKEVPPPLIEAGLMSGCTKRQLLWWIKLPLATPHLFLGLNQTIMLALSMLVITALVGTRDLGQEVFIALTKANAGQGIVAGLSVAFIAIITDRIINALAAGQRERLGV